MDIKRHIKDGIDRVTIRLSIPKDNPTLSLPNEPSKSNDTGENSSTNDVISNTAANTNHETVTMEATSPQIQLNSTSGFAQVPPKLPPKLVLSKFKGNVAEWTGFWLLESGLDVAVHGNFELSVPDSVGSAVADYAIPALYYSLPQYLKNELIRLEKRAIAIIMPDVVYRDALKFLNIKPMENHHENLCDNLFRSEMLDTNHKICHLLPERHNLGHFLRNENNFNIPLIKTNRTKNSFIFAMCNKFNKSC
jgi:hypothetical protein